MIKLSNISLQRSGRWLLKDVNLRVNRGDHIGLLGANGSGKTSLFKLIIKELESDTGEVHIVGGTRISHAKQETQDSERSAIDYVLDGDQDLRQLQQQLQKAEDDHHGQRIAELHDLLDNQGAYSAPSRAAKLLTGLGFKEQQHGLKVTEFSGGWRMRLNLAQALMCPSDLLLLDEPTNHLDLDAIFWLEDWLKKYPGTLILISHDESFLNATVTHIVHLENQQLTLYKGDYNDFVTTRAQALSLLQATASKQQRERAHIESFISRFRAQATKAKQVQSRIHMLEKLEQVSLARVASPIQFRFKEAPKQPNPLLTCQKISLGYSDYILDNIELAISSNSRVGLIGRNGAGKSTFIKAIAGLLAPQKGCIEFAENLKIGYFSQQQLETLNMNESALWHIQKISPEVREQEIRDFLGQFNFQGSRVDESIAPFSGGEKARLCLALIIWQKPNLLLLDEPTNHLDLDTRQALSQALQDYTGSMLLVSHDRTLLSACCDELWLVDNKRIDLFDGDLTDYKNWLLNATAAENKVETDATSGEHSRQAKAQKKKLEAQIRNKLSPLKKQISQNETKTNDLQLKLEKVEQRLSDSEIYEQSNKSLLTELLNEQRTLEQSINQLEEQWFELHETIDDLERSSLENADELG